MVGGQKLVAPPLDHSGLPVKGGRQSMPDGVSTLGGILSEMGVLTPEFNIQLLGVIEKLAMYNPEVSNAMNNIVQLGNTLHGFPKVYFDDDVPEKVQKEALMRLKRKSKDWYAFSGGVMSLVTDLLTQAAISGCLSAESVPMEDLSGVKKIVLVAPKNIRFKYDPEKDTYNHFQVVNGVVGTDHQGMIPLNGITYSYIALQRMGEKPYAIPPFLAAMDNVYVGAEMSKDIKNVIKRLGAAGFLEVLLTPPKVRPDEVNNPTAYENRTSTYLSKVVPEIEKGMAKGFVTGFKGEHEFEMHNTASNIQGAHFLLTENDHKIMRGLKQDPMMFGENISTTETLARVILAKMTTQIKSYQYIVTTFLEKVFLMDLQLAGFPINHLDVEIDPPLVSDKLKDAQAIKAELENLKVLYSQGIIDQNQFAVEAGYEKPAEEEPRKVVNPLIPIAEDDEEEEGDDDGGKKTDPAEGDDKATKDKEENKKVITNLRKELGNSVLVADIVAKDGTKYPNAVLVGYSCINYNVRGRIKDAAESLVQLPDLVDIQANSLGADKREYPYGDDNCSCGGHTHESLTKSDDEFEAFLATYLNDTRVNMDKATKKVLKKLSQSLSDYKTTVSGADLVDTILYTLYKEWGESFSEPQKRIIARNIKSAYSRFRRDPSVFGGAEGIPKGTFNLIDARAIEYYAKSDSFYLGKFVTDDDLKKKITKYIKDEFLADRVSIDLSPDDLALMNKNLGKLFTGQEWKLERIIATTLNKMRNTAAVNYMKQANVTQFEVVGVSDRLQCAYCANMQGKTFSVEKMIKNVEEYTSSDPNYIGIDSPFVTSVFKSADDMKELTGEELQGLGVHSPPFHSNCRDQVIAIIE